MKLREHKKIVKQLMKTHEQKMAELKAKVATALEEKGETLPDNETAEANG
jgi:hypothetical protein